MKKDISSVKVQRPVLGKLALLRQLRAGGAQLDRGLAAFSERIAGRVLRRDSRAWRRFSLEYLLDEPQEEKMEAQRPAGRGPLSLDVLFQIYAGVERAAAPAPDAAERIERLVERRMRFLTRETQRILGDRAGAAAPGQNLRAPGRAAPPLYGAPEPALRREASAQARPSFRAQTPAERAGRAELRAEAAALRQARMLRTPQRMDRAAAQAAQPDRPRGEIPLSVALRRERRPENAAPQSGSAIRRAAEGRILRESAVPARRPFRAHGSSAARRTEAPISAQGRAQRELHSRIEELRAFGREQLVLAGRERATDGQRIQEAPPQGAAGLRGLPGLPGAAGRPGARGAAAMEPPRIAQVRQGDVYRQSIYRSELALAQESVVEGEPSTTTPVRTRSTERVERLLSERVLEHWARAASLMGLSGAAGLPGLPGAAGLRGLPGIPGTVGLPGATGAAGLRGLTGLAGADSLRGLPGASGQTGIAAMEPPRIAQVRQGDVYRQNIYRTELSLAQEGAAEGEPSSPSVTAVRTRSTERVERLLSERVLEHWARAASLTGLAGARGLSGAEGHPGAMGAAGARGLPGAEGRPGAAGLDGARGLFGAAGAAGLPGVVGAGGPIGLPGAAGAMGLRGLTGLAGAAGAAGRLGARGETGVPGLVGLRGLSGQPGTAGLRGLSGQPGAAGLRGLPGLPGAAGRPGARGAAAVEPPRIAQVRQGDVYRQNIYRSELALAQEGAAEGELSSPSATPVRTRSTERVERLLSERVLEHWARAASLMGLSGAAGRPGAAGLDGARGLPGAAGHPGAAGAAGARGLFGAAGIAGLPGVVGAGGSIGLPGAAGAMGLRGLTGSPGAAGAAGRLGARGETSVPGLVGLRGLSGQPGAAGLRGLSGQPGGAGLRGLPGLPGAAGRSGARGAAAVEPPRIAQVRQGDVYRQSIYRAELALAQEEGGERPEGFGSAGRSPAASGAGGLRTTLQRALAAVERRERQLLRPTGYAPLRPAMREMRSRARPLRTAVEGQAGMTRLVHSRQERAERSTLEWIAMAGEGSLRPSILTSPAEIVMLTPPTHMNAYGAPAPRVGNLSWDEQPGDADRNSGRAAVELLRRAQQKFGAPARYRPPEMVLKEKGEATGRLASQSAGQAPSINQEMRARRRVEEKVQAQELSNAEITRIVDRVYRKLESRIATEYRRRGM